MKRRGFLGPLGGAAVAGPVAAKNAIATSALGSGRLLAGMSLGSSYGVPQEMPSRGMFSAVDRMAKLKRLLAGEETVESDPYDIASRRKIYAEHQVNALHSVSMPAKLQMLSRKVDAIEAERKRDYWLMELMNLEKGGG